MNTKKKALYLIGEGPFIENIMLLFALYLLSQISCFALCGSPIHTPEDYIHFANERPSFDSACGIYDEKTQISQSGVLISPDIIATAAHGIVGILGKATPSDSDQTTVVPVESVKIYFAQNGAIYTYEAQAVIIDSRYLVSDPGAHAKYDIAFIKLKHPITSIQPTKMFRNGQISSDMPLYVATFGNADRPKEPLQKRAFMLCELDNYFAHPLDGDSLALSRSILLSSLFFNPTEHLDNPGINGDELTQRTFEANQNWLKYGKKPYALALPGTSGAPVYVTLNTNGKPTDYLLGVVTSFSHLSGRFQAGFFQKEHEYILSSPRDAIVGSYQTILALPYLEDTQAISKKGSKILKAFRPDPFIANMISKLRLWHG